MGFFDKIRKGLTKTKESLIKNIESVVIGYATIDEDFLEDLEMVLLSGDIGVRTTDFLMRQIRRGVTEGTIHNTNEVMPFMEKTVEELLKDDEKDLKEVHHPEVILVVGVNGTGKTTSAAKLGHLLQKQGSRVLLAAADTFRAAAVEQLQSWADKLGIPIYKGAPNQDPASVCYEAHTQAIREGFQYLICDTAGRLHTRHNLMEELSKIRRTLAKQDAAAPPRTLLVVDATTGANALAQAREFHKATPLDSVIITKMDGSGKGGVAVAIMDEMHISPAFLGTGEGAEDFEPFNRDRYVDSLL